jgi:hypothetical protein
MTLGFSNLQDLLDVLLVPLSAALLAVLWPFFSARRRRKNFEYLIRRELREAAPDSPDPDKLWHEHLPRRFIHQDIISDPVSNMEFLLSLHPDLTYNISQMWDAFSEAVDEQKRKAPLCDVAHEFCGYLGAVADYLDGVRPRSERQSPGLKETVWQQWQDLITMLYPVSSPT